MYVRVYSWYVFFNGLKFNWYNLKKSEEICKVVNVRWEFMKKVCLIWRRLNNFSCVGEIIFFGVKLLLNSEVLKGFFVLVCFILFCMLWYISGDIIDRWVIVFLYRKWFFLFVNWEIGGV